MPDYNTRVRELFANTPHAGSLDGASGRAERAGSQIELSAELDRSRLVRLRFRAYGCPHTIAAAELFCEAFEGRDASELADCRLQELIESLAIPVEKTGQILLLEDAIHALADNCLAPRD